MRCLAIVVSVVLVAACERPVAKPTTPEATYRLFAEALRGRDPKTAWELLSPTTKSLAEARSKAVSAASHGLVRDEPMVMVLQSGVMPDPKLGEITVIGNTENSPAIESPPRDKIAVLEVGPPERRQRVTLIKPVRAASWSIDLSAAFRDEGTERLEGSPVSPDAGEFSP